MTSTLMPRASAKVKVWPNRSQMANVATAMQMTVGTKMPETLSAVLASGAFVAAASRTRRMTWDSVVS